MKHWTIVRNFYHNLFFFLANLYKDFIHFSSHPYLGEDSEELSDTKYTFLFIYVFSF